MPSAAPANAGAVNTRGARATEDYARSAPLPARTDAIQPDPDIRLARSRLPHVGRSLRTARLIPRRDRGGLVTRRALFEHLAELVRRPDLPGPDVVLDAGHASQRLPAEHDLPALAPLV